MTEFSSLGLVAPIVEALAARGYATPTPIQVQAIPPALQGRDLLGIAQTGTGKTAAFAAPILDRLSRNPGLTPRKSTRVLVLAPTRELADQIATAFRGYGQFLRLTVATAFGGVPINRHVRQMERGTDVLVATPGRLIDLIDAQGDDAQQCRGARARRGRPDARPGLHPCAAPHRDAAAAPAADAVLLGHHADGDRRAGRALPDRSGRGRGDAVGDHRRAGGAGGELRRGGREAGAARAWRCTEEDVERALVFTRTKHGADRVVKQLAEAGIDAAAIHGNKSQPQRERALAAFRAGRCRVLVATDIAARGIDVPGVSHVINFELPNVPEQYVHRIGRTARAGASGLAISFVADDERPLLRDIEKLTRQKLTIVPLPEGFTSRPSPAAAPVSRPSAPRDARKPARRRRSGAPHAARAGA